MITIKHPKPNTVKFGDIVVGETFIAFYFPEDKGVYSKVASLQDFKVNAFNYATGLLAKFSDDEDVILVNITVEYSLRT